MERLMNRMLKLEGPKDETWISTDRIKRVVLLFDKNTGQECWELFGESDLYLGSVSTNDWSPGQCNRTIIPANSDAPLALVLAVPYDGDTFTMFCWEDTIIAWDIDSEYLWAKPIVAVPTLLARYIEVLVADADGNWHVPLGRDFDDSDEAREHYEAKWREQFAEDMAKLKAEKAAEE